MLEENQIKNEVESVPEDSLSADDKVKELEKHIYDLRTFINNQHQQGEKTSMQNADLQASNQHLQYEASRATALHQDVRDLNAYIVTMNEGHGDKARTSRIEQLDGNVSSLQVELQNYQERCIGLQRQAVMYQQKMSGIDHLGAELETANAYITRLQARKEVKVALDIDQSEHLNVTQMSHAVKRYEDAEIQIIILMDELTMAKTRCSDLDCELDDLERSAQVTYDENQVILNKSYEENIRLAEKLASLGTGTGTMEVGVDLSGGATSADLRREIAERDAAFRNIETQLNKERAMFERRLEDMSLDVDRNDATLRSAIAERDEKIRRMETNIVEHSTAMQSSQADLAHRAQLLREQLSEKIEEQIELEKAASTEKNRAQSVLHNVMENQRLAADQNLKLMHSLKESKNIITKERKEAGLNFERIRRERVSVEDFNQLKKELSKCKRENLEKADTNADLKSQMKDSDETTATMKRVADDREEEIDSLQGKYNKVKDKYHSLHDDYDSLQDKYEGLETEHKTLKDTNISSRDNNEDIIEEKSRLVEKYRSEINQLKLQYQQNMIGINATQNKLKQEAAEQKLTLDSLKGKQQSRQDQNKAKENALVQEITELRLKHEDFRQRHSSESSDNADDIQDLKDQYVDMAASNRHLQHELNTSHTAASQAADQILQYQATDTRLQEELAGSRTEVAKLKHDVEKMDSVITEMEEHFMHRIKSEDAKQLQLATNNDDLQVEKRALHQQIKDINLEREASYKKFGVLCDGHQNEVLMLKRRHAEDVLNERRTSKQHNSQLFEDKLARMSDKIRLEHESTIDDLNANYLIEKNKLLLSLESTRSDLKVAMHDKDMATRNKDIAIRDKEQAIREVKVTSERIMISEREHEVLVQKSKNKAKTTRESISMEKSVTANYADVHSPQSRSISEITSILEEEFNLKIRKIEILQKNELRKMQTEMDTATAEIISLRSVVNSEVKQSQNLHTELMDAQVKIDLEGAKTAETSLPIRSKIKRFLYRTSLSLPKPLRDENVQTLITYTYLVLLHLFAFLHCWLGWF